MVSGEPPSLGLSWCQRASFRRNTANISARAHRADAYTSAMDELDVAVAAVIVAVLTGLSGIVLAAWSTKRNEKMTRESLAVNERLTRDTLAANERLTRENRIEDKRADSYLEILRM